MIVPLRSGMGVDPPRERFNINRPTVHIFPKMANDVAHQLLAKTNLLEYVDQDEVLYVEQELIWLYDGGENDGR